MAKININQPKNRVLGILSENEPKFSAPKKGKKKTVKEPLKFTNTINSNLYLFNAEDKSIITPADDDFEPILVEFDDPLIDLKNLPDMLKVYIKSYSDQIEYYQKNKETDNLTTLYLSSKPNNTNNKLYGATASTNNFDFDDFVDLGLPSKTLWATRNLGTNKTDTSLLKGDYYAWGELSTKDNFTLSTYNYYQPNDPDLYKDQKNTNDYNKYKLPYKNIGYSIARNSSCDATYKLVNNDKNIICIPSKEQWQELIQGCEKEVVKQNNISIGYKFTSYNNGKSIYLPFTGYKSGTATYKNENELWYTLANRCYDVSTCYKGTYNYKLNNKILDTSYNSRYVGTCIRPVCIPKNKAKEAMINFKWGQGSTISNNKKNDVYKQLLPKDPCTGNIYSLTGCPATALAQIVAYYGKEKNIRLGIKNTPSYSYKYNPGDKYGVRSLNIPTLHGIDEFDYNNLEYTAQKIFLNPNTNTNDINPSTNIRVNAVATLMKHIGYASQINYTSQASGGVFSNLKFTMCDYLFNSNTKEPFVKKDELKLYTIASAGEGKEASERVYFPGTKMFLKDKAKSLGISSEELLFSLVIEDIEKGYPVLLAGYSNNLGGHAFICDGYDPATNKFHINWGWDGNGDCWCYPYLLLPSGQAYANRKNDYNFHVGVQAITGIHPNTKKYDMNDDGEINITDLIKLSRFIQDSKKNNLNYNPTLDLNNDNKVDIKDINFLQDIIMHKNPYEFEIKFQVNTNSQVQLFGESVDLSSVIKLNKLFINSNQIPFENIVNGKYQLSRGEYIIYFELIKETAIPDNLFNGCTYLKEISTIPSFVTTIGNNAFKNCTTLNTVKFREGLEYIGSDVFSGCTTLKRIELPESVTSIGNNAFKDSTQLKKVILKSTTPPTLGTNVFTNTSSSLSIIVPKRCKATYIKAKNWSALANIITETEPEDEDDD